MKLIIFSLLFLVMSVHSHPATLNVSNGILLGAFDVEVGGILYDVSFVNSSCIAIFDGCDSPLEDFTFHDANTASLSSHALIEQVLIDTPEGQFDSIPWLTFGCTESTSACVLYTPYDIAIQINNTVIHTTALNRGIGERDSSGQLPFGVRARDHDMSISDGQVWTKWTLSEVPIPAAAWLFGTALLGLVGLRRKR